MNNVYGEGKPQLQVIVVSIVHLERPEFCVVLKHINGTGGLALLSVGRRKPSTHLPQDLYAVLVREVMLSHLKDAPWFALKPLQCCLNLIGTDVLLLRGEVPRGALLSLAHTARRSVS